MTRLLVARMMLTGIGIVVWGYGNATSQPQFLYSGMGIIAIALILRFLPKRWFDKSPP